MSVHARMIARLNGMPLLHANLIAIGACSVTSFVCCVSYATIYSERTPGTWQSSLWGEATKACVRRCPANGPDRRRRRERGGRAGPRKRAAVVSARSLRSSEHLYSKISGRSRGVASLRVRRDVDVDAVRGPGAAVASWLVPRGDRHAFAGTTSSRSRTRSPTPRSARRSSADARAAPRSFLSITPVLIYLRARAWGTHTSGARGGRRCDALVPSSSTLPLR